MAAAIYNSPGYPAYGAYELKACYQRNLFLASLTVFFLVVTAVTVLQIFFSSYQPAVKSEPIKIRSIVEIPPPPPIKQEFEFNPQTNRDAGMDLRGTIPTPLPDSEVIDDNVVIPTRQELADFVDRSGEGIGDGEGTSRFEFVDTVDYLPERGEFNPVEKLPEFVYQHQPEYPKLARMAGIEGSLWVSVLVSKEGKVLEAEIYKSSGTESLDDAALKAAFKNKFTPGIQNNRPVNCWVSYEVVFTLEK
ncbi:MAG: energy transducer TonB [candidate division Zixibacteria bacterium]|nr:energy transducer TonB [candidate division Zixibacteria bacterium]